MASVWDSPIAGDPLALPLVESVQLVGIITNTPLFGIQIPPLIKLLPQVIPICIRRLCDTNGKSVRRLPAHHQLSSISNWSEAELLPANAELKHGSRDEASAKLPATITTYRAVIILLLPFMEYHTPGTVLEP